MNIYSFKNLKIYFKKHNFNKILIIRGNKSFNKCGVKSQIKNTFKNIEFKSLIYKEQTPNYENLLNVVQKFDKFEYDAILAVGGGKIIDVAKLFSFLVTNSNLTKFEILQKDFNNKKIFKSKKLITIPTTTGSGSEVTPFAVMYVKNVKYSIAHRFIKPDFFIIDPKLTLSNSRFNIACSSLDALSQAIESYWSVKSNKSSIRHAKKSINLIIDNIDNAVNKKSIKALRNMALAANYSGKAISITQTTAPHALSYSLTKIYKIPHGQAVSIFLYYFFEINYNFSDSSCNDKIGKKHVINKMNQLFFFFKVNNYHEMQSYFKNLCNSLGVEIDINTMKLNNKRIINTIIKNINFERFSNNPTNVTRNRIYKIFNPNDHK